MKWIIAWAAVAIALVATSARAETLQAPVGGEPISLGAGRVACAPAAGGWGAARGARTVQPPPSDDAIGKATLLEVAPNAESCTTAATQVTLVATARWPVIDASASTLFVDDGRLDLRGRGLRGVGVRWFIGSRAGDARCDAPDRAPEGERCVVAVGRGLPADPNAHDLEWTPAGAHAGPDVHTFGPSGALASPDDFALRPARVVVSSLVPADVGIDLAGGTASRIPLTHPEAVAGADCGSASCDRVGTSLVVGGISTISGALAVHLRLVPGVVVQRGDAFDAAPVVQIPVLPCPMSIASGEALRGVDASRVVVKVDPKCAGDVESFNWYSAGRTLDRPRVFQAGGAAYALLDVGRVDGADLVITASRGGPDSSVVGQARTRTRPPPAPHATLVLDGESIDFLPTNRPASVRWATTQGAGQLHIQPVEGVYDVRVQDGTTLVQGQPGAAGLVALRFAWRVPTLPGPLASEDLAIALDPVERPMREASIPVPLGATASGPRPLVELVCGAGATEKQVAPGANAHVPFAQRDACRLVLHRERLTPQDGAQHLRIDVQVTRVDGESRPESHVTESVALRAAAEPRLVWIKGVIGPFDRAVIQVAHSGDSEFADGGREEPSVTWSVVFGTGHVRLYATTAIPTGLYRVADRAHSGILTLNFGVIMRATWLDSEGHEGFLGAEAGMLAEGLANDLDSSGHSLTQVATVVGLGLSVPIANRSLATETSINLHAWLEYEVSRDIGGEPGSPVGFVFGPSISIGNIGTNL